MAAAAGLVPMGMEDETTGRPLSREDALARIEELQRTRPAASTNVIQPPQRQLQASPAYESDAFGALLNPVNVEVSTSLSLRSNSMNCRVNYPV